MPRPTYVRAALTMRCCVLPPAGGGLTGDEATAAGERGAGGLVACEDRAILELGALGAGALRVVADCSALVVAGVPLGVLVGALVAGTGVSVG